MSQVADDFRAISDARVVFAAWRRGRSSAEGPSIPPGLGLSYGTYVGVPVLEAQAHLVTQRIRFGVSEPPKRRFGGLRGEVRPWSPASRRRLRWTLQTVEWEKHAREWVVVTLTLPGNDVELEMDGRVIKRQFQAFMRRWSREYGHPMYVWKLEFQRRGAAHFAVVLPSPLVAVASPSLGLGSLQEWVSQAWYDVVGSGSEAHLRAGTQVSPVRDVRRIGSYIAGYMLKSGRSKEYQHVVPEGFVHVGRWWGVSRGLCAPVVRWVQTPAQAYATRRVLACSAPGAKGYTRWMQRSRRKRVSTLRVFTRQDAATVCRGLMGLRQ